MEYKIEDSSRDRNYFTIIPNYILNHSSAIDKAIYIDMKRATGEGGTCFMTEETMCKRNEIGEKALHKSLKYLIDHKWIEFVGMTSSKTRPIKTYKVLDIWKQNTDFYEEKKIVAESGVSKDSRQKQTKIVAESSVEEEQYKEEPIYKERSIKKDNFSSIKSLQNGVLQEIADKYEVPVSFVMSKLEDMELWLESKGKRYKNYKAALMNWVKKDALQIRQKQHDKSKIFFVNPK